eukprot:TRINITY_DN926_c1_g1_i6.p1 TRINITY_DN926_c1_g1~~TRINITY_DN926_c1_g1_i6.p1  ORF type:complete len:386 (+),score=122.95 TRINITY_DN926_c1_g1_i6:66-1223(+)
MAVVALVAAAAAGFTLGDAPLQLLPQGSGDESPACLDGSPYGLYFVPSLTNSTKWTIFLEGGGWCYDEVDCYNRSKTRLGSSKHFNAKIGCGCMSVNEHGDLDTDCNCLYLPYGDGASFSGYRAKPWPVPGVPGAELYFRGIKNLDAAVEFALKHGMDRATELVVSGSSAGGLSTFLHTDRIVAQARARNPALEKVVSVPVDGFFLDHDNYNHGAYNYTAWMKYIYHMQNLTFGADGGLTAACQQAYPGDEHYCFMSPHMPQFVQTPLFAFNSKFDLWQLQYELQLSPAQWTANASATAAVLRYGDDFLAQFKAVQQNPAHGGFITTCICHGCPWSDLVLDGKNGMQLYADWFYGKVTGGAAFAIDTRRPNGDGTLSKLPGCTPF